MGMRRRALPASLITLALAAAACIAPTAPEPEVTMTMSPASSPTPTSASATAVPAATPTPPTVSSTPSMRSEPSLVGETRNAWAFAPVDAPDLVTVEGAVPRQRAWSTSKVLVAAAYLQDVADGDPSRLEQQQRQWISRALGESDMDSLLALRGAVSGDRGVRMTAILRSIGDETTVAPSTKEGTMEWTVQEQVRFMAALARGEVVSSATSAYLLEAMQPVESQRWGLAGVAATAAKGGWLTPTTETRQMGLLDGYAVAVITDAVGPAVLQSDGDEAHVEQLDRLAEMLELRLAPDG
ncbi:MAG: hypothetical protein ABR500_16670 [Dermatophilaceae bacterium]|nr:hypothetical protein [Intrasporangiaceae bacterium]